VQAGTSLNAIQQLLGHRSLHTTSVYLQHIGPAAAVAEATARTAHLADSRRAPLPVTEGRGADRRAGQTGGRGEGHGGLEDVGGGRHLACSHIVCLGSKPSVLADRGVRGDNHGCARDVGSNSLAGFAHHTILDLGAGPRAVPVSSLARRPRGRWTLVTKGRRGGRCARQMAGRGEGQLPPSCAFPRLIAAIVPAIQPRAAA
jgi:hypothetical protein